MSDNNESQELTFFEGEYHRAAMRAMMESAGIVVMDHTHAYNQASESINQMHDLTHVIDIAGSVTRIAQGLTILALSGSSVEEAVREVNGIFGGLGENVTLTIPEEAAVKMVMYYIQSICSCWNIDLSEKNFRRNFFDMGNMAESVAEVSGKFGAEFEKCGNESYQEEIYNLAQSFWADNCVIGKEDYIKRTLASMKGRAYEVGYMVFDIIASTNVGIVAYEKAVSFWDGISEIANRYEEEDSFMGKISENAAKFINGINEKIV